jgi:hypothetical protein
MKHTLKIAEIGAPASTVNIVSPADRAAAGKALATRSRGSGMADGKYSKAGQAQSTFCKNRTWAE